MAQHSRYRELADSIRERIMAGEWKAGERLPTLDVLAKQLGASRNTVNRAIGELEIAGLVWAVQGRGVTVREGISRPRRTRDGLVRRDLRALHYLFSSHPDEAWTQHGETQTGPVALEDAHVAGLLDVERGSTVWRRRWVTGLAGEVPLQINLSWIHPRAEELVRGTGSQPAAGDWLYAIEVLGDHWPLRWVEYDIARMPTKDEADALKIPTASPVREISLQGSSGRDGHPVEVTQHVVPADRIVTVRVLQRDEQAAQPWPADNAADAGSAAATQPRTVTATVTMTYQEVLQTQSGFEALDELRSSIHRAVMTGDYTPSFFEMETHVDEGQ